MYFVYNLCRKGVVVYTGLTTDPGRSVSRHLAGGRQFDTLHILERLPRLADAKLAAQRRRGSQSGQAVTTSPVVRTSPSVQRPAEAPHSRPSRYAQYATRGSPG